MYSDTIHAGTNNRERALDMTDVKIYRRSFLAKISRNKMFLCGGVVVLIFLICAVFSPFLTNYDPNKMNFLVQFHPPGFKHLMGTDQFGRDIATRIFFGIRISLTVSAFSVFLGGFFGIIIGALSGFFRGLTDDILMRLMDSFLAFPPLLLALGLVAAMGPGIKTVSIAIAIVYMPAFARVMRSSVLNEREKEYVEAVTALGQSKLIILMKHIGPNALSPILVQGTIFFARAIITEAALSFLGVGIPPPTPSLGTMLNEALQILGLPSSYQTALFPGIAISIAVLGFNLLGDGLRDIFDPRIYSASR